MVTVMSKQFGPWWWVVRLLEVTEVLGHLSNVLEHEAKAFQHSVPRTRRLP